MYNIEIFDKYPYEYDKWYERNKYVYLSELNAIKELLPEFERGIEIGVGSARFALPLGLRIGIEPAKSMAKIAKKRGLIVIQGKAEELPFRESVFDFVLMVVTICFVENYIKSLKEVNRILKTGGVLLLGIVDKNSFLGEFYEKKRKVNKFYKRVRFFSVEELTNVLKNLGFNDFYFKQTIFKYPNELKEIDPIKEGYGKGGFVAFSTRKF